MLTDITTEIFMGAKVYIHLVRTPFWSKVDNFIISW